MNIAELPQTKDEWNRLWKYATESEKEEIAGLLTDVWYPNNGAQSIAYECQADELLYGGAAGGGKSDLLLGVARRDYSNSLLLRRTFGSLEESLILRSLEFYDDPRRYNRANYVWRFIDERRVKFGHCQNESDAYKYRSAQYDFIGFDEVTEFTRFQYEYIKSRLRRPKRNNRNSRNITKRPRVIACTNPGGEGNDWVMQVWAAWLEETHHNPAKAGEIRYFKRDEQGNETETTKDEYEKPEQVEVISRTFIPARLDDNPYLSDDYERMLANLPEPYRSQLRHGDWNAGIVDDRWQVIPTTWVKAAINRHKSNGCNNRAMDCLGVDVAHGGADKTVLVGRWLNHFNIIGKHPGRETPDGASVKALVLQAVNNNNTRINIDSIGVGASAYDYLRETELDIRGFVGSEKSTHKDKSGQLEYLNKRAEAWWAFREALDPNSGEEIELPPDPEILADLTCARWKMQANGIKIEAKEDIVKRIGRSPDVGEAIIYAYWGMADPPASASLSTPKNAFLKKRF